MAEIKSRGWLASTALIAILALGCAGTEAPALSPSEQLAELRDQPDPEDLVSSSTTLDVADEIRSSLCVPVPDSVEIATPSAWEPGETLHLEVETVRQDPRPGRSGSATSTTSLTVIDVDLTGTTFEWRSEDADLSWMGIPDSEELRRAAIDLPPHRIVYRVSHTGVFEGVENLQELRNTINASLSLLLELAPEQSAALAQLAVAYDGLSDDAVTRTFASGPMLFHGYDGIILGVGQVVVQPAEVPNSFGGPPVRAEATLRHTGTDEEGCEVIEVRAQPSLQDATDVVEETVSETFGEVLDLSAALAGATLEQVATVQVDASSDRIKRVRSAVVATLDGQAKVDALIITDKTDFSG